MNIRDWEAPAVVYVMSDRAGDPLYVGVTTNLRLRLSHHRSNKWWFPSEVSELRTEPFATIREAAVVEVALIRTLQPRFNRDHIPRHRSAA